MFFQRWQFLPILFITELPTATIAPQPYHHNLMNENILFFTYNSAYVKVKENIKYRGEPL